MSDNKAGGAVRKRQKIQDSSKQMFMWVAGMSAVIGLALVVSWFVWNQITFKTKVVSEKNKTVKILQANNQAAPILRDNIRVLETNEALSKAKANEDQRALQVVLDALPADGNSLALGASLQHRLTAGISGMRIEMLSVAPAAEELSADAEYTGSGAVGGEEGEGAVSHINFTVTVSSREAKSLDEFLKRLERSIRVIDVERLAMDRSANQYSMTLTAHGYYQPAKQISLGSKVVKP